MTTKLARVVRQHRRASDILCLPNAQVIQNKTGASLYDVVWAWDDTTTFNEPFKLPNGKLVDIYDLIAYLVTEEKL